MKSKVQCSSISRAALALAAVLLISVAVVPWAQGQTDDSSDGKPIYKVLHRFAQDKGGVGLLGVIRDAEGNIYGTTQFGGDPKCQPDYKAEGCGVVFKLDAMGKETVLHAFTGKRDGGVPVAGVIRDEAGNLYGTTSNGGDPNCFYGFGCGVVFKLDPAGKETVLHTFTGAADDGSNPSPVIRDQEGNLYGAANGGPTAYGFVFKLNPGTGDLTVLYPFTGGTDGGYPGGELIRDAAGNLYGAAGTGGDLSCDSTNDPPGCGVVFKLDPAGKETVLYTFTGGKDGSGPSPGLVRDAEGNLYGTAVGGSNLDCFPQEYPPGCGLVFKLNRSGKFTLLYTFTGGADGAYPAGLIRDEAGNLYGTTVAGGYRKCEGYPDGFGVVFKLDTIGKETVLHTFGEGMDGGIPEAGVIRDKAGNLYGTTYEGGCNPSSSGVVFKLTPSN